MKNLTKHSFIGILLFIIPILLACKKEKNLGNPSGTNTIAYQSDYSYQYKFRPLSIGNTYIFMHDVDIYSDILGRVTFIASGGKTDGKADWFRDITISNIKLIDDINISLSGSDLNFSHDLINCKLVYSYYPVNNSGQQKKVLATFNGYNSSESKVKLSSSGEDLTNLFKENPVGGKLSLEFSFSKNAAVGQYANVGYNIAFDYHYSYTSMASTK